MNGRIVVFFCLGGLVLSTPLWTGCPSEKEKCDGCFIDGKCVETGVPHSDDPCLVCDPENSLNSYSTKNCSDGVSCNGEEMCNSETGECESGEVICPDDEFCDPDLDECVISCPYCSIDRTCYWENETNPENVCVVCRSDENPYAWTPNDGASCDDSVFCNGTDTCSGTTCSVHEGDPCIDDELFCNGTEACDENTKSCVHSGDPCGDGETCYEEGTECCQAYDHLGCNPDGNVAWVDGCGRFGEVVEECVAPPAGECQAGQCICGLGKTGPGCEQCIVFVTSTGDDENDGGSWSQAKATLQGAIATAEASGCPQVWVAEGEYPAAPSGDPGEAVVLTPGLQLYGGFAGNEISLFERNPGDHPTVLDGELGDPEQASDNVCSVVVLADDSKIDGFTVRNGGGMMGCPPNRDGMGVLAHDVNATIEHCLMTDNGVGYFGNGTVMVSGNSRVHIHNTVFENNFSGLSTLHITDTSVVELSESLFRTNFASYDGASAIILRSSSRLAAVRCRFEDNISPSSRATVLIQDHSTAEFTNCAFLHNSAEVGGLFHNGRGMRLVNCLVAGNEGGTIGGISAVSSGPVVLQNCTIAANTGDETGGLYTQTYLMVLRNSIIAGNTSNASSLFESQMLYSPFTQPLVLYSNVEGDTVYPGEGNSSDDPLFINADPDFGPLDMHLDGGSPCIDAGSTALILPDELDLDDDGDLKEPTPFDLDEQARVVGGSVDMGAYETQ